MKQRYFIFDPNLCFGCNGCVAACAAANGTGIVWWRRVHKLLPPGGSSGMKWISLSCNHCADPPCVKACPSSALLKRSSDGVVLHREDRCLGCRYCQMACPYDAIRWNAELGIVGKCHYCHERLDSGREPVCVETCFAGALAQLVVECPLELSGFGLEYPGFAHIKTVAPSILFSDKPGAAMVSVRKSPFPPGRSFR